MFYGSNFQNNYQKILWKLRKLNISQNHENFFLFLTILERNIKHNFMLILSINKVTKLVKKIF